MLFFNQHIFKEKALKNILSKFYVYQNDPLFQIIRIEKSEEKLKLNFLQLAYLWLIVFLFVAKFIIPESISLWACIPLMTTVWCGYLSLFIYEAEKVCLLMNSVLLLLNIVLCCLRLIHEDYILPIFSIELCHLGTYKTQNINMHTFIQMNFLVLLTIFSSLMQSGVGSNRWIIFLGLLFNYFLTLSEKQFRNKQKEKIKSSMILTHNCLKTRDSYFGTIIHEVRNPLAASINSIEVLSRMKQMGQKARQTIQLAQQSCDITYTLISNYLDIFKMKANQLVLNTASENLISVIMKTLGLYFPKAKDKGLKFILNISKTLPSKAKIDAIRFSQIIMNLLSNSLKFTESGQIKVQILWKKKTSSTNLNNPHEYSFTTYDLEKTFFWKVDALKKAKNLKLSKFKQEESKKASIIPKKKNKIQKEKQFFTMSASNSPRDRDSSTFPDNVKELNVRTVSSLSLTESENEATNEINMLDYNIDIHHLPRRSFPRVPVHQKSSSLDSYMALGGQVVFKTNEVKLPLQHNSTGTGEQSSDSVAEEKKHFSEKRNLAYKKEKIIIGRSSSDKSAILKIRERLPKMSKTPTGLHTNFLQTPNVAFPRSIPDLIKRNEEEKYLAPSLNSIASQNSHSFDSGLFKEIDGILIVEISDTGIGISQQALKTLFQPFTQANSKIYQKFGGTGLGLWFSKKVAQMMGGDIVVTSEQFKGSKFTVKIPVQFEQCLAGKNLDMTTGSILDFVPSIKEKIMIYEKDIYTCRNLMKMFYQLGCDPFIESDPKKAIERIENSNILAICIEICQRNLDDQISSLRSIANINSKTCIIVCIEEEFKDQLSHMLEFLHVDYLLPCPISKNEMASIILSLRNGFSAPSDDSSSETSYPLFLNKQNYNQSLEDIFEASKECSFSSNSRRKASGNVIISYISDFDDELNLDIDEEPLETPGFHLPTQSHKLVKKKKSPSKNFEKFLFDEDQTINIEDIPHNILLIDDENTVLLALSSLISSVEIVKTQKFNIITARNGYEGYEIWKREAGHVILIFVDMHMPSMGGLELIDIIRKYEDDNFLNHTDVVLMTGESKNYIVQKHDLSKIDFLYEKPIRIDEIEEILSNVLSTSLS